MNPKPFSSLNHLTVPVGISRGTVAVDANRCPLAWPRGVPTSANQAKDSGFDALAIGKLAGLGTVHLPTEGLADRVARVEPVHHAWIDVRATADGGSVRQVFRHGLDGLVRRSTASRLAHPSRIMRGEPDRREHRGIPRPEILCGELAAGQILQMLVDLVGAHVVPVPPVPVGE